MTKMRLLLPAALFALPLAVLAAPASKWVSAVALSPIGGHVMGNPAAPTRLVEYVSYTCSHCAQFVEQASEPLRSRYVSGGKVSVEVRNAIRDRYDLTAALLARCGGPRRFFGNHEALFANQGGWMDQIMAYDKSADKPAEQVAAMRDIGRKTGLYALMKKRGFTDAQLDACVASPTAMKQVMAMSEEAWKKLQIRGTPAFTVDGSLVNGSDWMRLQAALP